jgi:hypothetical protein
VKVAIFATKYADKNERKGRDNGKNYSRFLHCGGKCAASGRNDAFCASGELLRTISGFVLERLAGLLMIGLFCGGFEDGGGAVEGFG